MGIDRRTDNRRWKAIDDLWKEAFDDTAAALTVTSHARQTDAFGRMRVSNTGQRLDGEFIYGAQDDYFDHTTNNGTITHNANTRDLTLSVSAAANGDFAKVASYPVPYTPGNSQLIDITGVLDLAGIGGGTAEIFVRTSISGSAVETTYTQSTWSDLKVGEVDWTQSHIFTMDFQSLKVGTIRFGMVKNGIIRPVLSVHNDNIRDSGYWQLANGSVYWDLYSDGTNSYMEIGYGNDNNAIGFRYKIAANASATMKVICCTVKSEGGESLYNMPGLPRAADTNTTSRTVSNVAYPVISIRPKTTFLTYENLMLALPKSYTINTNQPIHFHLMHDTTLDAGTVSWQDVDTNDSMMEYDVSATSFTGGHKIASGYLGAAGTAATRVGQGGGLLGKTVLWNRQDSVTGVLTLAAIRTTANDATVYAGLEWEEIR